MKRMKRSGAVTTPEVLTPTQRATLAFDVYSRVFDGTESFEIGNIGSDLAYLMGAILNPSGGSVQWGKNEGLAILKILRRQCPREHMVWRIIESEAN